MADRCETNKFLYKPSDSAGGLVTHYIGKGSSEVKLITHYEGTGLSDLKLTTYYIGQAFSAEKRVSDLEKQIKEFKFEKIKIIKLLLEKILSDEQKEIKDEFHAEPEYQSEEDREKILMALPTWSLWLNQ